MVQHALEAINPDAVLIEGPADAAEILSFASHANMKPPVAILVYDPDSPSVASYYPYAEFSPEWQAMRWAQSHNAALRFIDLPQSLRPRRESVDDADPASDLQLEVDSKAVATDGEPPFTPSPSTDPLEALALAAGYTDGEAWWGTLIEERRGEENPLALFAAISAAMASTRAEYPRTNKDPNEPAREAFMRKSIRTAIKEGHERIAVICGAWHAPTLSQDALQANPTKADDELIKALPKSKTVATWIPWTYDRLSYESGYGAGVASPGWYEHLWLHHDQVSARWLTKVARFMRDEDLDASSASVIESVRLADSLAALRGRTIAGLDELSDATLSILCHGNPLPMVVIEKKLIVGERLGEIPEEIPSLPLHRDITALQKSLRMKVSAVEALLDLDQRKETDMARSQFLHRLSILGIEWGKLAQDQRQGSSTFHEIWNLQWKPEFAVDIIDAARWGNTVADAAAACVQDRSNNAKDLSELTELLDHVMLADLPAAIDALLGRIQSLSAVTSSLGSLMEALPQLAGILRYGNVRKTDAALVEPLLAGLLARICASLVPACASLDDESAHEMWQRLDSVNYALSTLSREEFTLPWHAQLSKLAHAKVHGLVEGRVWRILLDSQVCDIESASTHISLALSPGNDPTNASAWIEGFLSHSGEILVHDKRLLSIIDQWVCSLSDATFDQVCPIARRTFGSITAPERRKIGERIKSTPPASVLSSPTQTQTSSPTHQQHNTESQSIDYDPERGRLVDPVLKLIFGEPLP